MNVCGFIDFLNPLRFFSLASANEFVTNFINKRTEFENEHKSLPSPGICHNFFFYNSYFNLLDFSSHIIVITCYLKILLSAFNIDIEDVEDKLPAWKAKSMLKQDVTSDLAPFQMFRFYNDFRVKDTSIWGDISFEDADELLISMANSQDIASTSVTSANSTIPTIAAAASIQQISVPSTSHPKNTRRS